MLLARRHELVCLTEAAMAVALSVVLGNVRLVELPNGGSIALATLPLLALAVARGPRLALLAGCCAGLAHALSGGIIIHPAQLALDYLLAYAALAVAGIRLGAAPVAGRTRATLPIIAAMSLHLAAMVASGVIFFAPVAGGGALGYSIAYNAATVVPETLLALWLVPPLVRALARANPADSWRRGLLDPPRVDLRTPRRIHARTPVDIHASAADIRLTVRPSVALAASGPMRAEPPPTLVRRAPFSRPAPIAWPRTARPR